MTKIVLATGGFDPIHSGHIKYFTEARSLGDMLVIGLNSDAWLTRKKGQPFMPIEERRAIVSHLAVVDSIMEFKDDDNLVKEAIEAKGSLENYMYQIKKTVNEDNKDKISDDDKKLVNDKLTELDVKMSDIKLDTIDNYQEMRKDLDTIFTDIMTKLNKDSPPNVNMQTNPSDIPVPDPDPVPDDVPYKPTIDEVD